VDARLAEIFIRDCEQKLAKLTAMPSRPPSSYVLTEDGEASGTGMDINQAALEALNAAETAVCSAFEPNTDLFDLVGEPDYVTEKFTFVRDVLIELPDVVLAALCKQRGWKVER
jgi:hypothetical protein